MLLRLEADPAAVGNRDRLIVEGVDELVEAAGHAVRTELRLRRFHEQSDQTEITIGRQGGR